MIYTGRSRGSHPKRTWAHNFECSGFIPLVRDVYYKMEIGGRRLPFCIFQHAMTEFLVAYQLYYGKYVLKVPALQRLMNPLKAISADKYFIPQLIFDYICGFGEQTAPTGDKVYWNLPDIAIPQGPIIEDQIRTRSGTFGKITAENHNVYECYVSPYVTSEYILQSAKIEETISTYDWTPLPDKWYPENSPPNENLLGYRRIESLPPDSKKVCSECEFADSDSVEGLLCHSVKVLELSSSVIRGSWSVKPVKANFKAIENKAAFIFKEVIDEANFDEPLYYKPGTLKSPFSFTASQSNKANICTYKRKRNNFAPGTCYLTNGKTPEGWLETINSNFTCSGPFALQHGFNDREDLRNEGHAEY